MDEFHPQQVPPRGRGQSSFLGGRRLHRGCCEHQPRCKQPTLHLRGIMTQMSWSWPQGCTAKILRIFFFKFYLHLNFALWFYFYFKINRHTYLIKHLKIIKHKKKYYNLYFTSNTITQVLILMVIQCCSLLY